MGLRDYKAEERPFALKGGSFAVKGLSLVDFTSLVRYHMPDLEAIFDLGQQALGGKKELTEEDIGMLVVSFTENAPGLISNLIALASGDNSKEAVDAAATLPFPVQVDVTMAIVTLTFEEVGGIKKAFGVIAGLLKNMKPGMMKTIVNSAQ